MKINVKPLIADLLEPNPKIFWLDLLLSSAIGWGSLSCAILIMNENLLAAIGLIFVSAACLFRGIVFQHEMVHIRRPWIKKFEVAWNLLIGFPFFIPAITYRSHLDHHRTKEYGTLRDPRYFFKGSQFRKAMLLPPLASPFAFFVISFRYLVLGPISLLAGGRFRKWVLTEFGLQKINFKYKAKKLDDAMRQSIFRSEIYCITFWTTLIALMSMRVISWYFVPAIATVSMVIFICNHFRAFGAHFYRSSGATSMTFEQQLKDSISIVGPCPLSPLFGPVGLRFHSLHHLVPTLPYHSMRAAHNRLMKELPADHPYRQTVRRDLITTLIEIWKLHDPKRDSVLGQSTAPAPRRKAAASH
ncbi:MAG: fatty acid desaturase [Planctomycetota bacterium]